jgi:hypothetical protein
MPTDTSEIDGISNQRAGHAMAASSSAPQFGADAFHHLEVQLTNYFADKKAV